MPGFSFENALAPAEGTASLGFWSALFLVVWGIDERRQDSRQDKRTVVGKKKKA